MGGVATVRLPNRILLSPMAMVLMMLVIVLIWLIIVVHVHAMSPIALIPI